MYREYPVNKEQIQPFLHRPVGVVMLDGSRYVGVVTGCSKGHLILNGRLHAKSSLTGAAKTHKRRKRRSTAAPATHAVIPPYAAPVARGPKSELKLARIAFLFELLP